MSRLMTTAQLMRMTQNPEKFIQQFAKMFADEGLKINMEKTLANVEYFDQKDTIIGGTSMTFFDGNASSSRTNLASFIKPEAEHTLIYGIRIMVGDQPLPSPQWETIDFTGEVVLRQSVISVIINGVTVIKRYPTTAFYTNFAAGDNYGSASLEVPLLWGGQQEMSIILEQPLPIVLVQAVRVSVIGIGLI